MSDISIEHWKKTITDRVSYFNSIHHSYEAKELGTALETIERLVPPSPAINEGEKESEDDIWLDVRDDIGDQNKDLAGWVSLPLELLKSKYTITRK